jgi:hypothetical protein
MKRLFYGILFLSLVSQGVSSCKKQKEFPINHTNNSVEKVQLHNKVVKFDTHQGYINFIENTSDSAKSIFLRTLSVQGFDNYFSNPLNVNVPNDSLGKYEMDEFFGQILNDQGIFQIENYLFKVSILDSSVYVLPFDEEKDDYEGLANSFLTNKKTVKFTTDDDVIDLVFGNGSPKCGGSQSFEKISNNVVLGTGGEYCYFRVNYLKLGVYYTVRVKGFQHVGTAGYFISSPILKFEIKVDNPLSNSMRMRPRPCSGGNNVYHHGGLRTFTGTGVWSGLGGERYQTWKGYERVRGLNGYRIFVKGNIDGISYGDWIGREVNSNF